MSMFGEFYVPSTTGNVVDLAACRVRHDLHEAGAIDKQGNFYVDQPFNPDWVAKYKRSGLSLIKCEIDLDQGPSTTNL